MTKLLSKLELTAKPNNPTDKLGQRRHKLLERLSTQPELCLPCSDERRIYLSFRTRF